MNQDSRLPRPADPDASAFPLRFPGDCSRTLTGSEVQQWLDSLPPLYRNPMDPNSHAAIAAWLYSRAHQLVQAGLQSLDSQNWATARQLCGTADTVLQMADSSQPERDTRCGSAPKPPRERAGRLFATLAHARTDLLSIPDGLACTGISIALDDAELLARDVIDNPIPDDVRTALDRMCTPLDESILTGATAAADAHSMQTIRAYVLGDKTEGVRGEAF